MKYKHGVAVMRLQPLHLGHVRIIDQMLNECEEVTILVGSYQESGTDKNPFLWEDRVEMLQNVYGDLINIGLIEDIHNPKAWGRFVIGHVLYKFPELPVPDAVYEGIENNSTAIMPPDGSLVRISRNKLSGTFVRELMDTRNEMWKQCVPEENIELLETLQKEYVDVV